MHHNVFDNIVTKLYNYSLKLQCAFKSYFAWVHSIFSLQVYLATKWMYGQFSLTLLQSHLERNERQFRPIHRVSKGGFEFVNKCFNLLVMS